MKQFHEQSSQGKNPMNSYHVQILDRIASVPYNKYGKHLLLTKRLKTTFSDAERQTLLRMALGDVKKHFLACVKQQLKTRPAFK